MTTARAMLGVGLAALGAAACVPGGPIYVGPPVATIEGHVYTYELQTPAAGAEVCVFGTDTLCLEADRSGSYRAQLRDRQIPADGTVRVRFRLAGLAPAVARLDSVLPGERRQLDCAISNRLTLSTEPADCLPAPSS